VYADNVVMQTIERGGVCVTADYGAAAGGISVVNTQRQV
jgi:uncharacterized protein YaiI (UPF0178 family)